MNKANKIYIDKGNLSFCYYLCITYGEPDKNSRIEYEPKDLNKRLKELKAVNAMIDWLITGECIIRIPN